MTSAQTCVAHQHCIDRFLWSEAQQTVKSIPVSNTQGKNIKNTQGKKRGRGPSLKIKVRRGCM